MRKPFKSKPKRELTDCRVTTCERRMVVGYLMCSSCWKTLSQDTQRTVRQAEGPGRAEVYHAALREAAAKVESRPSGPRTLADVMSWEGSVAC